MDFSLGLLEPWAAHLRVRCLENVLTDYAITLLVALFTSEFWQSINKLTERLDGSYCEASGKKSRDA
jgi:hypothetical protein